MMRDYNGVRGPIPWTYRSHDWQTMRLLRELGQAWRKRRQALLKSHGRS